MSDERETCPTCGDRYFILNGHHCSQMSVPGRVTPQTAIAALRNPLLRANDLPRPAIAGVIEDLLQRVVPPPPEENQGATVTALLERIGEAQAEIAQRNETINRQAAELERLGQHEIDHDAERDRLKDEVHELRAKLRDVTALKDRFYDQAKDLYAAGVQAGMQVGEALGRQHLIGVPPEPKEEEWMRLWRESEQGIER